MRHALHKSRLRLGFARIVFAVVFMVVAGRAFQLQLLQGDRLKRLGERQHAQALGSQAAGKGQVEKGQVIVLP